MKIFNLSQESTIYTSNAYLVLGDWNTIDDRNTLIDTGQDPLIFQKIENINTGLGKHKIDQVILTHSHSDHTALLNDVKQKYHPKVYANNIFQKGIDRALYDSDFMKIGDTMCEIFHITVHSSDSLVIFCEKCGVLFTGDTRFPVEFDNEDLFLQNKDTLVRLSRKRIKKVFPGHGSSVEYGKNEFKVFKN